jgi:shikimate dehydrogenase
MTDGATQLVGLLGWPVEHSLSPAMHNAAFSSLGLNWHYVPLPVSPTQFDVAVRGLGALGFRGANVTVPHKQAAMAAIDSTAPNAVALGAVNTLLISRSSDGTTFVEGHNTDADGFLAALREGGCIPGRGTKVVVVGAGGAARAVVYGLLCAGVSEISVLNRTLARAEVLVQDLSNERSDRSRLSALPLTSETLIESARSGHLLVNATAAGMWPNVNESVWPDGVAMPAHLTVFDLVYNPLETRMLLQARQSGASTIDGLGMLIFQGAIAFEMWTGRGPISDVVPLMRTACERAMKNAISLKRG